jgi:hypothetical protein
MGLLLFALASPNLALQLDKKCNENAVDLIDYGRNLAAFLKLILRGGKDEKNWLHLD